MTSRLSEKLTCRVAASEAEILLDLHLCIFRDVADVSSIDLSRDIITTVHRVQSEGIAFLMKTLPSFGKHFLQACQDGKFQRSPAFHRRHDRALPEFLIGLTELVFDKKTGLILPEPCYVAAWGVHQITQFLYKYQVPNSWQQDRDLLEQVIKTNEELPRNFSSAEGFSIKPKAGCTDAFGEFSLTGYCLTTAAMLIEDLFFGMDLKNIVPRHGPGAVNEGGIAAHEKFNFRCFDDRLATFYPMDEYCWPSASQRRVSLKWENLASKLFEVMPDMFSKRAGCRTQFPSDDTKARRPRKLGLDTTKTIVVPKNANGGRAISSEPKERMWVQQGQARCMVDHISEHKWTKGHVNFKDQTINGRLALQASFDGKWATLDMKEASDRVSVALVHALFPSSVFDYLWASRSSKTVIKVPYGPGEKDFNEVEIVLQKFAPMGSAVCFPLESIVFWALAVTALQFTVGMSFEEALSSVFVFGDDIILPAKYAERVMNLMEKFGLLFNKTKSFHKGPFRESCGTDAFLGTDITPVRLKKRMPNSKSDSDSLCGWVDSANLLNERGLHRTAQRVFEHVESIIGSLPTGPPECGILCRHSNANVDTLPGWTKSPARPEYITYKKGKDFEILRRNPKPDFQGYQIKGYIPISKVYEPEDGDFDEVCAWLRYVSLKEDAAIEGNMREFGLRKVTRLSFGWITQS